MSVSPKFLVEAPEAMCAAVKVRLPELRRCEPYAGRFNVDELKKRGIAAPAVLVSMVGCKQSGQLGGGLVKFDTDFAAYVITKDGISRSRDDHAAVITQALLELVPESTWGLPEMGAAEKVEAMPLITGATRDIAVSLWAVTWRQSMTFFCKTTEVVEPTIYVSQAPQIGPEHEEGYQQIGDGA